MVKQSKTLKVTISGSFKAADNEIESFDNVTGIIPRLETEPTGDDRLSKADQMIIRRYAAIWIIQARKTGTEEPKYKRVSKVRQVFIDSIDENEENPDAVLSYVGKNVMHMNFEELQDFAASNDLSGIPLYRVNSLQHARRVAYSEYAIKVLGLEEYAPADAKKKSNLYDHRVLGFNPSRFEPIVADGIIRRYNGHVATIEETLDRENLAMQLKAKATVTTPSESRLNLDQLKKVADDKAIAYHKNIGYDQLYKKIYASQAA